MNIEVMTIDEVEEVSGGPPFFPNTSVFGIASGALLAWQRWTYINFLYGDMRKLLSA